MEKELLVALFSFAGTVVGTIGGIIASAKLTAYRIQQLEKKVDKHNGFAEKIPLLKAAIEAQQKQIDELKTKLEELQKQCVNHHIQHGEN